MTLNHDLKVGLGAFLSALLAQPLVQALVAGGHVTFTRDAVVSVLVGAATATVHKLFPEK